MTYESRWTGPLSIRHDAVMGIQVLALDGALDARASDGAREAVEDSLDHASPLVLDLRMLRAVDGAGLDMLRWALERLADARQDVAIVQPVAHVVRDRVAAVAELHRVLVAPDTATAIAAVSPQAPDGRRWNPQKAVQVSSRRDRAER